MDQACKILWEILQEDTVEGRRDLLEEAKAQIEGYFRGDRRHFAFPLDLAGLSDFALKVYRASRDIPYGRTRSYGWLAAHCGKPKAARAVGQALGSNPLPLVFPCHRVIRADGDLGGFGSGLPLKKRLLRLEGLPV